MNTNTDYSQLKISSLHKLCKERGLKGYYDLRKSDLIELLSKTSVKSLIEPDFVLQSMITYIGNKRKLVPWIMEVVEEIRLKLGKDKLNVLDGFAGSGVISRALMPFCSNLYSNDMEYYSYILLRCFLETPTLEQKECILKHFEAIDNLYQNLSEAGFITQLYAPRDTNKPVEGERVFYTRENALIIDTLLKYIFNNVPTNIRHYLLAPLIIKSSINVNTAGVFRGFYKKDGVGHFGGSGENALERILAPIKLDIPIWSKSSCKSVCFNSDIMTLIKTFDEKSLDLIYLDPPYNEHPYASNYFMLNLIAHGKEPTTYSKVSGIPKDWNKSAFNGRKTAYDTMKKLIGECLIRARYVLISYNNEGLVTEDKWLTIFNDLGCQFKKYEKEYDTYHGSRNLGVRNKTVLEQMYLISS